MAVGLEPVIKGVGPYPYFASKILDMLDVLGVGVLFGEAAISNTVTWTLGGFYKMDKLVCYVYKTVVRAGVLTDGGVRLAEFQTWEELVLLNFEQWMRTTYPKYMYGGYADPEPGWREAMLQMGLIQMTIENKVCIWHPAPWYR